MNHSSYPIPTPIGKLLSILPRYPGSMLFVAGLNLALARHLPPDVQRVLTGKKLRIAISDAKIALDFEWHQSAFIARRNNAKTDLTITASAHDFFLLAQRHEDPDTLFFSRRLAMEGDTELGLLVKNTLDAMDIPVFDVSRFLPDFMSARLKRMPGN